MLTFLSTETCCRGRGGESINVDSCTLWTRGPAGCAVEET